MDDKAAYLLNGLWTRHYDLGRVIRFRHVTRGRQVAAFEILTAEQHEYTAYLYPASFDAAQLERVGAAMEALAGQGFPVAVPIAGHAAGGAEGAPAADPPADVARRAVPGPQGTHLMVSSSPVGQYLLPDQWSLHDLSLLGLRLAWMHSLLVELVVWPTRPRPPEPAVEYQAALESWRANPEHGRKLRLDEGQVRALDSRLQRIGAPSPQAQDKAGRRAGAGWVHGDIQPAAVLLDGDKQIRSVMDWGLMHPGEPLEDVVDAFVHWCVAPDGTVADDRGRALLEAYRSLHPIPAVAWADAVSLWLARRMVDFVAARRILPRGYLTYVADPESLASALQFCDTR